MYMVGVRRGKEEGAEALVKCFWWLMMAWGDDGWEEVQEMVNGGRRVGWSGQEGECGVKRWVATLVGGRDE